MNTFRAMCCQERTVAALQKAQSILNENLVDNQRKFSLPPGAERYIDLAENFDNYRR
jgi:hypothetical protein